VIPEAAKLIEGLPEPLREAFAECYWFLLDDSGCSVYVKTIYVGFTFGEEMVCAIYPRQDYLEVAMALPEDVEGSEFKDATHLTWPTMPVAVEIRSAADTDMVLGHLATAVSRVATGLHDVRRPLSTSWGGRIERAEGTALGRSRSA
jgi:hypothetical protein